MSRLRVDELESLSGEVLVTLKELSIKEESYVDIGEYSSLESITAYNQKFSFENQEYRVSSLVSLPLELSGDWNTDKVNFVLVSSNQSFVPSIHKLLTQAQTDSIVEVSSYYEDGVKGGGRFKWDATRAKADHDGGYVISPTVPWTGLAADVANFINKVGETNPAGQGAFVRMVEDKLCVTEFGAVAGDSGFDNRVSFQACIDACAKLGVIFEITPTADTEQYHIKSFNPDTTNGNNCLIISSVRNFHAIGHRRRNTNVIYTGTSDGTAFLRVLTPASDWGFKLEDLGFNANNKLDNVLLATDRWYALSSIEGGTYSYAKQDGIRVSMYMSTLSRVHSAGHGRDAFAFVGPTDQGGPTSSSTTSLTVESCWARLSGRYGFSCENALWYSNFMSCGVDGGSVTGAADRFTVAYNLYAAHGVNLSACGAEKVDQYLSCNTYVSLSIDNPKGTDIGPTTGTNQAMIFLGGGWDCSIKNIPNGLFQPAKFQYAVATNANTGNEKIDIFGSIIDRSQCYFTPSASFKSWPDVFFFPGQTGLKLDRGKTRTGGQLYTGPLTIGPAGTTSYIDTKVVNLANSTVNPQLINLLTVSGSQTGQTMVRVQVTASKFAGSPAPAIGSATFSGNALIANTVKSAGAMTKTHGDAYTATLVWSGDTLRLELPMQYAVCMITVEFWSSSAFVTFT